MSLRPAITTTPARWHHLLAMIVDAIVVAFVVAHTAESIAWSLRWRYVIWPGAVDVTATFMLTPWLVGAAFGVAAIVALTGPFSNTRAMRAIVKVLGVVYAVVLVFTIIGCPTEAAQPWRYLGVLLFALGSAISFVFRRRALAPAPRRVRAIAIAVVLAALGALAARTVSETHAEYQAQDLRTFTIELASAYVAPDRTRLGPGEMPAVVIDAHGNPGDPVDQDGAHYLVHRSSHVVFTSDDTRRVRLHDGALSIRIDGDVADQLRQRSEQRMSQHDALYINGEFVLVFLYEAVVGDRLWLVADQPVLQRIYDRLAR